MTVKDIYNYIDGFAPFSTQDSFDNSGLLIGSGDEEVTKAAVCLDITNSVIEEARAAGAQLIVSHHPVIFSRPSSIAPGSPVYLLIKYGIAAICVHTPLDMAKDGISDVMYRLMNFADPGNAEVLHVVHSSGAGYGKIARFSEPVGAKELARRAMDAFGCTAVKYVEGNRPVRSCAVCSGAGNDEIYACIGKGVDAIITGDVKWHGFVDAKNAGITVIDAGHYHTEAIICKILRDRLSGQFPRILFFIPEANADVCSYLFSGKNGKDEG